MTSCGVHYLVRMLMTAFLNLSWNFFHSPFQFSDKLNFWFSSGVKPLLSKLQEQRLSLVFLCVMILYNIYVSLPTNVAPLCKIQHFLSSTNELFFVILYFVFLQQQWRIGLTIEIEQIELMTSDGQQLIFFYMGSGWFKYYFPFYELNYQLKTAVKFSLAVLVRY